MKLFVFTPYGIHPARSAGHSAVLSPLRHIAAAGHEVDIVAPGLRRFERRLPRSFVTTVAERLREHRLVSALDLARQTIRKTTRLPPIDLSGKLARWVRGDLLRRVREADVVQIESPWAFPFVRDGFDGPIAFVAHNVECDLHEEALRQHGGATVAARATAIEQRAYLEADAVFTFGEHDARQLEQRYGVRRSPCCAQPIGADVGAPLSDAARAAARARLGIDSDRCLAIFAASAHAPNVAAADFLESAAPLLAESRTWIVLAGSVRANATTFRGGQATGPQDTLEDWYAAADVALNPMFSGSGMNQKVAEYLARGLPVISTPFGARGFAAEEGNGIVVAEADNFGNAVAALASGPERRRELAGCARRYAEQRLDWCRIAEDRMQVLEQVRSSSPVPVPDPPPG